MSLLVIFRLSEHLPNATPVAAIGMFMAFQKGFRWSFTHILAAMLISDFFLGFHDTILFVYGSFALIAIIGTLTKQLTFITSVRNSFIASISFFVITNFGVWLTGDMYAPTVSGLINCFIAAIPFFRATLLGDLFYSLSILISFQFLTMMRPVVFRLFSHKKMLY